MLNLNLLKLNENKKGKPIIIEELSSKEIAVIGISLKLPMADNIYKFWNNLENGIDCVTEFPNRRKKDVDNFLQYLYGFENHPGYDIGSYLDDIDKFDYEYFKLSPKESSLMDPNQRLFLQTAMEALDDAGYVNDKIKGSKVGVYVGFHETLYNYRQFIAKMDPSSISISLPGNLSAIIASRISYFLDLTGPSLIIDTACSSSLVAVHLACQGIQSGDCEMAIAGGVRINLLPVKRDYRFGVESTSGRSRAFDETADGISSGEGVAAVILKPLSKAIMHKDNIYAVIKGSAINQDGSSVGITTPNVAAQEDVIVKAWKDASINPEEISFIETHGTGTKIGDPIEIEGIQRAFRRYTEKKQFCAIGSLKTNLGHLDNAAGIAGFIKSVLQLKYKKIVPLLHFKKPNSRIAFEESPLYVNDRLTSWDTEGYKRLCGVSSFGLSGTNCHLILEEAPENHSISDTANKYNIFTLSSMSKSGIDDMLNQYNLFFENKNFYDIKIKDLCYTANVCKKKYNIRLAVIFENIKDLKNKINILSKNNIDELNYSWAFYSVVDTNDKNKKHKESEASYKKSIEKRNESKKENSELKSLRNICETFVSGGNFELEEYYKGDIYKKISLPVYPFKKNRCWLDINTEIIQSNNINEMKNKIVLNKRKKEENKKIVIKGNANNEYSEMEKITAETFCEVLGYDEIDINSNIFDIGIDSILAVKIINNINERNNFNLEVAKLLSYENIRDFANYIESSISENNIKQNGDSRNKEIIERKEIESFELSYSQNRLWMLNKMDKNSVAYNMPGVYEIYGEVDKKCLVKAFQFMLDRHDSLRTIFIEENGMPLQKIIYDVKPLIEFKDLRDEIDKEKKVKDLINDVMNIVFDLSKWPLMKLFLVKIEDKKSLLMFNMHHIISDGWSFAVFIKELLMSYDCQKNNIKPEFIQIKKQYKDYIQEQNKKLTSGELRNQEKYWLEQFKGNLPLLNIPFDFKRPSNRTFKGDEIKFFINDQITFKIKEYCRLNNITPNIFFLAVYCLVLNKYSSDNDIIIGSLVNGRKKKELELLIGNFINYLPIRIKIDDSKLVREFFTLVKNRALEAYINQDYPFDLLINLLSNKLHSSHNPIYDTMLVYHSQYFLQDEYEIAGLKIMYVEIGENKSVLDLKLDIFEYDDKTFIGKLQYSIDLFKKETIADLVDKFNKMIELILADNNKRINQYNIFSDEEKKLLESKKKNNQIPVLNVNIASTFTSEPVKEYIEYWCKKYGIETKVEFAPYNQILQELLDEKSLLSSGIGINVILLRFEDWIRYIDNEEEKVQKIENIYEEFIGILKNKKKSIPYLVCIFPVNKESKEPQSVISNLIQNNKNLGDSLREMEKTYVLDFNEINSLYDIDKVFDEIKDHEGHLPFSDEFYAAMGTLIARFICSYKKSRFKVLVLDCDNTLWGGICGEDGPEGVKVDGSFLEFQRLIKNKKEEGFLLVINSKNNESDVMEVFEKNPRMILKKDDFVNFKINWNSKVKNIEEIARELNLGIDSFIFFDDSSFECMEMMTYCPEILTIRLPEKSEQFPVFFKHIWALDVLNITEEDKNRTEMYKVEMNRNAVKGTGITLESFIEKLQLKVSVRLIEYEDIPRVSQMTQRTNQFNLSTKRRTISEIEELIKDGKRKIWVIQVNDKFGDYGLSGAIITESKNNSIEIDTMLLSCRVLGKKVEDAVISCMGKYLKESGKEKLTARYVRSTKNQPIKSFLERSSWEIKEKTDEYIEYFINIKKIPEKIDYIKCYFKEKYEMNNQVRVKGRKVSIHEEDKKNKNENKAKIRNDWEVFISNEENLLHKNYLLSLNEYTGKKLLNLQNVKTNRASILKTEYIPPENEMEKALVSIWQEVLKIDMVGVNDDFFDLGGNSLLIIKAEVELEKSGYIINYSDIQKYRTIRRLSGLFGKNQNNHPKNNYENKSYDIKATNEITEMKNNINSIIIDGIEPFNELFYKNCFFNSVFPILKWNNRKISILLSNDIINYTFEKEFPLDINIEYIPFKTIDKLLEDEKFDVRIKKSIKDVINELITSIYNKNPVVLWVDTFYESIRKDMYKKTHWPHTILIYGFDREEEMFNIIEHKQRDNLSYEKMKISFTDIKNCYKGFLDNFELMNENGSFFEFLPCNNIRSNSNYESCKITFIENMIKNKTKIEESLNYFLIFIENFSKIIAKGTLKKENVEKLLFNINEIINAKQVEIYKIVDLFGIDSGRTLLCNNIIDKWIKIRIHIAKYYYSSLYKEEAFKSCIEMLRLIYKYEYEYFKLVDERK